MVWIKNTDICLRKRLTANKKRLQSKTTTGQGSLPLSILSSRGCIHDRPIIASSNSHQHRGLGCFFTDIQDLLQAGCMVAMETELQPPFQVRNLQGRYRKKNVSKFSTILTEIMTETFKPLFPRIILIREFCFVLSQNQDGDHAERQKVFFLQTSGQKMKQPERLLSKPVEGGGAAAARRQWTHHQSCLGLTLTSFKREKPALCVFPKPGTSGPDQNRPTLDRRSAGSAVFGSVLPPGLPGGLEGPSCGPGPSCWGWAAPGWLLPAAGGGSPPCPGAAPCSGGRSPHRTCRARLLRAAKKINK